MASEWNKLRDEILLLYLVEGHTLKEVSSRMVQKHGFYKKKHQYEYVLKKWKISKNTKREIWEYVDHVVQKRQKQEKESRVQMHGIPLSDTRVRKAMQRYGRISLAEKFRTVPSPRSPGNDLISISTPPALEDQTGWPETLPWMQFDNKFHMSHSLSEGNLQLSETLMDSVMRTLATLTIKPAYCRNVDAIATVFHESLDWRAVVDQMLPSLRDKTQRSVLSAHIPQRAITPAIALKSLLFQISNKKVKVDHDLLAQNMMKLIHALCREVPKAIDYVLHSTDPTSAAIKETFFLIVARFGQSSLIAKFLEAGTSPDALIDHILYFEIKLRRGKAALERESSIRRITPLQLAAKTCDIEMAITLLEHGAKPNLGNPTPLQIACSLPPNSDGVRLVQILLRYGALLNTKQNDVLLPPLLEAVASGSATMVQYLLSEGATDGVVTIPLKDYATPRSPRPYISSSRWNIYPSEIPVSCPDGFTAYHNAPNTNGYTITALQIATIVGIKSIVEILTLALHGHEDQASIHKWALVTACLAADEDMVCQSLDAATDLKDENIWINYALCAAAWIPDCRIARRLIRLGAAPRFQVGSILSAVQAAALYKNVDLIKLLHSFGYDINAPYQRGGIQYNETRPPKQCRPLECAILVAHIQTVRVLLQLGARVTGSIIALATHHGSDDMILDLLGRGADVNAMLDGRLPLEIAIKKRKGLALISKLVESGAEISTRALITAIRNNDEIVSRYLLDSGADVIAPTTSKYTVLDAATETGNMDIMQIYFDCGGRYSSSALLLAANIAVLKSDYSIIEYLIQQRPTGPSDAYENSLFVYSILKNDTSIVKLFLDHNISSATSHYCWATSLYCWHYWIDCDEESWWGPRLPCQAWPKFMEPDRKEFGYCSRWACSNKITPLWAAAHMKQKSLVEHFTSGNHPADALLLESTLYDPKFSSFEIRQQLIETYPLSSIRDNDSCQRLLIASIRWNAGHELIQQHINSLGSLDFMLIGYTDDDFWTPLQFSAKCGNTEHARQLLDAQANINEPAAGDYGRTALQWAVEQDNSELTMFLLERGADINAPGSGRGGGTALQLAVSRENLKMAMLLLDHGADANGPPSVYNGKTALEESASRGLIDMVALLLPHICFHGPMRVHFIRAVAFAEQNCHYATANFLKRGRWTEVDHELFSKTSLVTEEEHTCPRFLYDEQSWEGICWNCKPRNAQSGLRSSSSEENITPSVVDLTESGEQATEAEALILTDDLALPENQSETLGIDQLAELTDLSFGPPDITTRWLDDLVVEYFESLDGNWQET